MYSCGIVWLKKKVRPVAGWRGPRPPSLGIYIRPSRTPPKGRSLSRRWPSNSAWFRQQSSRAFACAASFVALAIYVHAISNPSGSRVLLVSSMVIASLRPGTSSASQHLLIDPTTSTSSHPPSSSSTLSGLYMLSHLSSSPAISRQPHASHLSYRPSFWSTVQALPPSSRRIVRLFTSANHRFYKNANVNPPHVDASAISSSTVLLSSWSSSVNPSLVAQAAQLHRELQVEAYLLPTVPVGSSTLADHRSKTATVVPTHSSERKCTSSCSNAFSSSSSSRKQVQENMLPTLPVHLSSLADHLLKHTLRWIPRSAHRVHASSLRLVTAAAARSDS
jgi:hypothetical protein